ncbi:MAG TPA: hypothetical protein VFS43_15120 [Polyangiaceae bacterium]|nr:hypothetical protein [Polyangiaceae bacterium]
MIPRVEYGTGRAALELQREHSREMCDIEPLGPVEHFGADCEVAEVGSTVFFVSRSTPVAYARRPVHVVDPADVARALEELYGDRPRLEALQAAAFRRATAPELSWSEIAKRFLAVFGRARESC